MMSESFTPSAVALGLVADRDAHVLPAVGPLVLERAVDDDVRRREDDGEGGLEVVDARPLHPRRAPARGRRRDDEVPGRAGRAPARSRAAPSRSRPAPASCRGAGTGRRAGCSCRSSGPAPPPAPGHEARAPAAATTTRRTGAPAHRRTAPGAVPHVRAPRVPVRRAPVPPSRRLHVLQVEARAGPPRPSSSRVRTATSRPSFMMPTRSACSRARKMSWVLMKMARPSPRSVVQQRHELGARLGVEPARRLVEDDVRRVLDDGDGDAELLAHPLGEDAQPLLEGLLLEADAAQHGVAVLPRHRAACRPASRRTRGSAAR